MRVFLWEASTLTCRRPAYLKLVCPNCSNLTKIQSCNSYTIYPDPNNECFTSFPKICKTLLCFHPSLLVFTKTSCFAGVRCWQNMFTLHILCLSLSLSSPLSSCCNFLCHWLCICLPFVFVGWQCRVNQYVSRVYQAITGSQPPWGEWDRWKKRMLMMSYSKIENPMVLPNFVPILLLWFTGTTNKTKNTIGDGGSTAL